MQPNSPNVSKNIPPSSTGTHWSSTGVNHNRGDRRKPTGDHDETVLATFWYIFLIHFVPRSIFC
ncbi:hypothetical protein Hanom_Chr01g00016441 [Helianthus anomalus]